MLHHLSQNSADCLQSILITVNIKQIDIIIKIIIPDRSAPGPAQASQSAEAAVQRAAGTGTSGSALLSGLPFPTASLTFIAKKKNRSIAWVASMSGQYKYILVQYYVQMES